MTEALVDNDVLLKTAVFGLALPLLKTKPFGATLFHALGAAKFIIRKKMVTRPPSRGIEQALSDFESALELLSEIEPTAEEISLAAEFEFFATEENLDFDAGESLLCAVLLKRNHDYLFTGDKRAISSVAQLLNLESAKTLAGKLVCLEQLIKHLMEHIEPNQIRSAVCSDNKVDLALANCFSCHSKNLAVQDFRDGLDSYINHLRERAPQTLAG